MNKIWEEVRLFQPVTCVRLLLFASGFNAYFGVMLHDSDGCHIYYLMHSLRSKHNAFGFKKCS